MKNWPVDTTYRCEPVSLTGSFRAGIYPSAADERRRTPNAAIFLTLKYSRDEKNLEIDAKQAVKGFIA